MAIKKFPLLLCICFFSVSPIVAQTLGHSHLPINKYNQWLKALQLNRFFTAEESHLAHGYSVLVIKPSGGYATDSIVYLPAVWKSLEKAFEKKKLNICYIMLKKWARCNNLPLSSVKINILSSSPDIFSIKISYADKLVKDESLSLVKGVAENTYDLDRISGELIAGDFNPVTTITDLRLYKAKLAAIFHRYHSRGNVYLSWNVLSNNNLQAVISNLRGQFTEDNYNEMARFTISLGYDEAKRPEIKYNMQVAYASGIFVAPKNPDEYHDASVEFANQLADYNAILLEEMKNIFE